MNKNSPLYDYEIDLVALFKIIWDGKIKILFITIISFLVGLGYNSQIPINYSNSLTINLSKDIELINFANTQKLIRSNSLNSLNSSNSSNSLNSLNSSNSSNQLILVSFIYELEDYEEFLLIVRNTKKIQGRELFKYAKLLEIVKPKNNEENFTIDFNWPDPNEAKKILQETLNLTSKNLKRSIDLELSKELEFRKKFLINKDIERLNYLKEQSAIAKELNILKNQIDNVNLSQSSVSLSINTADIAYYLRGYKAIDKEIELIESRKYQNLTFMEQELNNFKDKEIEFVKYNVNLMDHNSLKNEKLILIISILLGLTVGIFYVLISNTFKAKKISKKTN